MFIPVLVAIFMPFFGNVHAQNAVFSQGAKFDYVALKEMIETQSLNSIPKVLAALPPSLKSRFTLMYKSESPQAGTSAAPRAILFSSDGSLIVTFNGDPSLPGFDALEVLSFDKRRKDFTLHEISFDLSGQSRPRFSEPNPTRCVRCHGAEPHPIWNNYPIWAGAYGSYDDRLTSADYPILSPTSRIIDYSYGRRPFLVNRSEKDDYFNFRKLSTAEDLPDRRYSKLIWGAPLEWPYTIGVSHEKELPPIGRRPNLKLTMLVASNMSEHLASRIQRSPLYPSFKSSLLFAAFCSISVTDIDVITESMRKHESTLSESERKAFGDYTGPGRFEGVREYDRGRGLTRDFEISPYDWSILLNSDGSSSTGYRDPGAHSIFEMTMNVLITNEANGDQDLLNIVQESKNAAFEYNRVLKPDHDALDFWATGRGTLDPKIMSKACPSLRNKSAREIVAANRSAQRAVEAKDQDQTVSVEKGKSILSRRGCIECHSPSDPLREGPPIPFGDETGLAKRLNEGHHLLYDEIARITEPDARPRMPLAQEPLADAERQSLLLYLKSISRGP